MNQPDRYSRFVLPAHVTQAVDYKADTKMRACGQFDIWLEDHTVGNLLRQQLLSNPQVVFAGYRIPHPLTPMMTVRVQTTANSHPPEAMNQAIEQLRAEVTRIKDELQKVAPREGPVVEAAARQQPDQQYQPQQQGYGYDQQGYGAQQGGYGEAGGGYAGYPPQGGGGGGGYTHY